MRNVLFACACAGVVACPALASVINEAEPNDTLATANFVGTLNAPGGAIVVDGDIDPGDVDWISFELTDLATLVISSLGTTTLGADAQFQLVDSGGTILEFDDDDGPGLLPALQVQNLPAGVYSLGVSGFPDATGGNGSTTLFDGLDDTGAPHPEDFDWKVTISANIIPAPGAAALAGFAGLAVIRRRR